MSTWQDISTAPKDGKKFLAFWPEISIGENNACVVTTWFYGGWQSPFETADEYNNPTHWMPLPPPPEST